jgi:hypothetical protein
MDAPGFNHNLGFLERVEGLHIQALIPQTSVEALALPILPGAARFNEQRLRALHFQPPLQAVGDELSAVVATEIHGNTVVLKQRLQRQSHILGPERTLHPDAQAFAREFVQHGQQPEATLRGQTVMHKVHRPHVIRCSGLLGWFHTLTTLAFFGFLFNLKAFLDPNPPNPLDVDFPAFLVHQNGVNPAVAETRKSIGQADDCLAKRFVPAVSRLFGTASANASQPSALTLRQAAFAQGLKQNPATGRP